MDTGGAGSEMDVATMVVMIVIVVMVPVIM
jgi:hypothetical protein